MHGLCSSLPAPILPSKLTENASSIQQVTTSTLERVCDLEQDGVAGFLGSQTLLSILLSFPSTSLFSRQTRNHFTGSQLPASLQLCDLDDHVTSLFPLKHSFWINGSQTSAYSGIFWGDMYYNFHASTLRLNQCPEGRGSTHLFLLPTF